VLLVLNSAISAAYYLRIVAALFLRPLSTPPTAAEPDGPRFTCPLPVVGAIAASVLAVLLLGAAVPLLSEAVARAQAAAQLEIPPVAGTPLSGFVSMGR
jgi:NADH:ubiquinone oxidoreductase subunit 2 (subunit N)